MFNINVHPTKNYLENFGHHTTMPGSVIHAKKLFVKLAMDYKESVNYEREMPIFYKLSFKQSFNLVVYSDRARLDNSLVNNILCQFFYNHIS